MIDPSTEFGRALVLGGTVALPSYPSPGTACVVSQAELQHFLKGLKGAAGAEVAVSGCDSRYVIVVHTIQPSTQVIRVVKLEYVRAFFTPVEGAGWNGGTWAPHPPAGEPQTGIVFVAEHAPVMTVAVFGGTAAESAEYCPPPCERGCDGYVKWTLRDGGGHSKHSSGAS